HVEDVVDPGQRLVRIALEELGRVREAGLLDVRSPRLDLRRVVLEREHAAAEVPYAGGEPDRRVAARAADLEHLAVGLRSDECEQELPGGTGDRARAHRGRQPARPLVRILFLEACEHGADAVAEHGPSVTGPSSRARPTLSGWG